MNKSLVYDLLSYSKSRSPERTCHTVTVTLDQVEKSPFYKSIKRLGVATDGRFGEVLTQATVVKALLPYISSDVMRDRDIGKRFGVWSSNEGFDEEKLIFRNWFLQEHDDLIATQLMNYFEAIRRRWPSAWASRETGNILPRSNGFRAFMKFLRPAYNSLRSGEVVKMSQFLNLFERVQLNDNEFTSERFLPGSTGESELFRTLMEQSKLDGYE